MALQRDLQSSLWFSYSRSMVDHPEAMPTLSPLLVCEAGPQSVEVPRVAEAWAHLP